MEINTGEKAGAEVGQLSTKASTQDELDLKDAEQTNTDDSLSLENGTCNASAASDDDGQFSAMAFTLEAVDLKDAEQVNTDDSLSLENGIGSAIAASGDDSENKKKNCSSQNTHASGASGSGSGSSSMAKNDKSSNEVGDRKTTQASGFIQILALLRKNLLTKYRSPAATFFELFSPLLMMLVLAAAYTLTEISYEEARTYSEISVEVPGPWLGLIRTGASFLSAPRDPEVESRRKLRRDRNLMDVHPGLSQMGFTGIFDALQEKIHCNTMGRPVGDSDEKSRKLYHDDRGEEADAAGDTVDAEYNFDEIYGLLDDASSEISSILKSPIPVPSFDQYVGTSLALSSLIGVQNLPRVLSDSTFGRQWGNLLTLGTIHISPRNNVTESFLRYLNETYPILLNSSMSVRVHDNEGDALRFIDNNLDDRTWALLDFSRYSEVEDERRFKIRMNFTTVPNTNVITNYVSIGLNTDYHMYYLSGYLTLQRTINEFVFSQEDSCINATADIASLWSLPMPTAAYSQNPFFLSVGYLLGLTMVMAFLYPTSRLIKTMVEEKESRMKETLFILGLRGWAHWLSWFFTSIIVFFIITVTVTASLTSTVIQYSNPGYIFVYVGLFSTATIGLCFTLAALFSRAKLAAIIGPVALFATILPRFLFFGLSRYEATVGKMIASLFPATAFTFGADIIADYEYAQQGIQEWNANEGDYSFNTSLGFLFFDTLLYLFLAWYLDQVMPRQYGVARKLYFLLMPAYWCPRWTSGAESSSMSSSATNQQESSPGIEAVNDATLLPGVEINNLVKQYYKNCSFPPAVDSLSLTMYESQITALLGHNGAGKTSTVSVLTGLFPPTSGDCILYGKSISQNTQEARQSIGICPQHNVLFDCLTVYEHLSFFMRLKGIRPDPANVRSQCEEIGLSEYLHTTSSALSGGNKRKLSVAIALSGDPRVLVLDEPTSAMDPHSRRVVWELLRAKRKGRVTLLTTHFMDEAELLSDRVAIMKEGKLQCCGSTLFLKQQFGLGYNLTVVLEPLNPSSDEESGSISSTKRKPSQDSFDVQLDRLLSFLQRQIPYTQMVRSSGKEATFRFPQGTESQFKTALDALEVERQSLGIGAYGIENSSLEEVFLQLAEDGAEVDNRENTNESRGGEVETGLGSLSSNEMQLAREDGNDEDRADAVYGHLSPLHQIGLLYTKRFVIQKRDVKGAIFTVLLPVLVIALVLLILMLEPRFVGPAIEVNPSLYKKSSVGLESKTGVPVGVGSSTVRNSSAQREYLLLSESVQQQYEFTEFNYLADATTSADVSRYLLDTYNERSHHVRFGAYALEDVINLTISMSWDETKEWLHNSEDLLGDVPSSLDLIKTLNVGGPNDRMEWRISVKEITESLYNSIELSPSSTFDAFQLQSLTGKALESIFAVRVGSNAPASLEEWLDTTNALFGEFVDELASGAQQANLTNYLETVAVELLTNVHANLTLEELSQWSNELFSDLKSVVDCVNTTIDELNLWSNETADAVMDTLSLNTTFQDLGDWAAALFNIITEGINRHCRTRNVNITWIAEDFLNIQAELLDIIRVNLGSNYTEEGLAEWSAVWVDRAADLVTRTNATLDDLNEWVSDLFGDANELMNATDGELQALVKDLFDNVTETIGDAAGTAVQESGLNFTEIIKEVQQFLEEEGAFYRELFVPVIVDLVEDIVDTFALNATLRASNMVSDFFQVLDGAAFPLGDRLPPVELTNTLALAFIVFADSVVRQYGKNATFSIEEMFSFLSEALGGSPDKLDGFVSLEVSSIALNLQPYSASVSARLQTANDVLFDLDNSTWSLPIDELLSQLPDGTSEYILPVNSKASILHNSSSPHAVAAFNQAYMEYLYATCTKRGISRLVSVNEPLPMTTQQSIEVQTILSILAALFLLIPFCYIPGAFIVFLVKERVSKSKHLQLVSGVNMTSYWIATYLWDLSLFLLLTVCIMVVFLIYGTESARVFVGDVESFFATMLMIFGYGMSILPFSYLLARNFDNSSSAQISVIGIIFLTGFVDVIAYFIMSSIESTQDAAEKLRPWFRLFPAFNIGEGFIDLAAAFWEREILFSDKRPLDWNVTGKSFALLYGLAPAYFLILLFLEYSHDGGSGGLVGRVLRYTRGSYDRMTLRWLGVKKVDGQLCLDDGLVEAAANPDITAEEEFVKGDESLHTSVPIVMRDLWKIYPPSIGMLGSLFACLKRLVCFCRRNREHLEENDGRVLPRRAVRGLTAAVQKGETFGLLGSNGAGKTTTLGILTGDIAPTGGEAYVAGHDITGAVPGGVAQARKNIGFCPQTDPLLDLMTGRETLQMFAKLRGVPYGRVNSIVDDLLYRLTLTPHADKTSESYSGGNKRKLSLGIAALVGDGGVLLIDECSSGLDPLARKKLWILIEQLAAQRSVIITTHSMEEAEALCSRIGIMSRGQFVALGSVQHLKTKYLDGYTIEINCCSNTPEHEVDAVVADVIENVIPGSQVSERHGRFLKFDVSRVSTIGLGTTFQRLQELKESGDVVENYSISQCSLEQVFLKLVKDGENAEPSPSQGLCGMEEEENSNTSAIVA